MNLDEAKAHLSRGMCPVHRLAENGCATCIETKQALAAVDAAIAAARTEGAKGLTPASAVDFAARRVEAIYAQLSQAGRVIAATRAFDAERRRIEAERNATGDLVVLADAIRSALADYDHAAARAAALTEGSTG